MVAMPWIFVEHIMINIAADRAAHVLVNVLIAIVVDVAEGNTVALLQITKAARCRDVLEAFSAVIAKHPVRNDRGKIRIARAEVKVQEPIIVQIAKVGSHRMKNVVKARLM